MNKIKKYTLLKTNLLICVIILLGFAATSIISYRSNFGVLQRNMEIVSALSSEGLYNQISSIFARPVGAALTMANDSLLKEFLQKEQNSSAWRADMREYLIGYQQQSNYDSVFLVSAATNQYYHYDDNSRVLQKENFEDEWYYNFLQSDAPYSLNVDNDQSSNNNMTVFVNCKIKNDDGKILGVVGVGLRMESLQTLLEGYEQRYGVKTYLVDERGEVEVCSNAFGNEKGNLFDSVAFAEHKDAILQNDVGRVNTWYESSLGRGYIVTRFEPNLKWHLIVEHDTAAMDESFNKQFARNICIIVLLILLVLLIITTVIRRYNARISELTVSQELEYQRLLHEMTQGLYENIFEINITRNCAGSEDTKRYFESLGISADSPYDKALHVIAGKQIKPLYIQGYLDTFCKEAVEQAYRNGVTNLSYDLMFASDGVNYHWIRIVGRIFFWHSDQSIRMIAYRMNIDAEKTRELELLDSVQRDSMTGLYNKRTTEELITNALKSDAANAHHAFLIFDIDNFKTVNDTKGHSFGDLVINEMAAEIKTQFRENDIVGRIGGDEFVVLMRQIDSRDALEQKLLRLCGRIQKKDFGEGENLLVSCSIGVALFPQDGIVYSELYEKADQALYHAKSHGKNSFVIFDECAGSYTFHANQRDMELLMSVATDGVAQYACTIPPKLLYFNEQCIDLFGVPATELSKQDFNVMTMIHPDDVEEVEAAILEVAHQRKPFIRTFRVRHQDGHYIKIQLKGVFINELYQNKYPVFYVTYLKQDD